MAEQTTIKLEPVAGLARGPRLSTFLGVPAAPARIAVLQQISGTAGSDAGPRTGIP